MPLLKIDLIEGRSDAELKTLLDTIHEVVVKSFEVPEGDRYQIVSQHSANEMIIQDTGLGFKRSDKVVVISMTSTQRSEKQKKAFYNMLCENLKEKCDIDGRDVMISITTNGAGDWSFGFGKAQFLTGEL